ncbi:MAG: hypothetical protein EOO20_27365, partial [Chryseobacterium sp.]
MRNCFVLLLLPALLLSCSTLKKTPPHHPSTLTDSLRNLPDSVSIGNITIKNLFKNQLLAHSSAGKYDSLMVIDKVYLA